MKKNNFTDGLSKIAASTIVVMGFLCPISVEESLRGRR
jgi:hypothetical protein